MPPTASADPAAPAADLGQILAALKDLTGTVDALKAENASLRAEVGKAKTAAPRFTKRKADDPHNTDARRHNAGAVLKGLGRNEQRAGGDQLPVTAHGQRIPKELLDQFGPKYEPGDPVRVRRDAIREGMGVLLEGKVVSPEKAAAAAEKAREAGKPEPKTEPVTWATVLDRLGCAGEGAVLRQLNLTKLGQWKYAVHVPGLTRKERGDGFYDYELEPAWETSADA